MKTILFPMFFISPPAERGKEIWSLQSTNTIEFASKGSCQEAWSSIASTLVKVDTVEIRGWCFTESTITDPKIMGVLPPAAYDFSADQLPAME
jgi:hypothetical protein